MDIKQLSSLDDRWDKYVMSHPSSTIFHKTGWMKVVEKTFGHKPIYLFAEEERRLRGILPIFLIRSLLFGKFMVSIPYAVYGGVLSDNNEAKGLLIDEAKRVANENGVRYLEFRNRDRCNQNLPSNDIYATFSMELPLSTKDCIKKLRKKARTEARGGEKYGLEDFFSRNIEEFYRLFCLTARRLGAPVYPISLFKNIMDEFPEEAVVHYIRFNKKTVLGDLLFLFEDTIMPYYRGADHNFYIYKINTFSILKLMEYGCEKGFRYFDLGRSRKGAGAYDFKRHLGFKPTSLYYEYYLNRLKAVPNINPSNPRFNLPRKIWQRLPLCVTRWLGPKIVRGIC